MSKATFEVLRARDTADRDAALSGFIAQLEWSPERLQAERERRLRILLAAAKARSPWHRDRLRHVDTASFTESDLPSLPTMSKADLMDNFGAVVTDPRLTCSVVDAYVEELPENTYLLDLYHILASGGSSGRRGTFVYDREAFVTLAVQNQRWLVRNAARTGTALPPSPTATVLAGRGAHVTWLLLRLFPPPGELAPIPATLPLPEIVARLNALQPQALGAYASMLRLLAAETRAGRLRIAPVDVRTCGEPLLPEVRAEIEAVWPVSVYNLISGACRRASTRSRATWAMPCTFPTTSTLSSLSTRKATRSPPGFWRINFC